MDSIRFDSVSKIYRHRPALLNWFGRERRGDTRALHNISLCIPEGRTLALLGPNGSGKTTLLKLISTILLPDQGKLLVEEQDTAAMGAAVRQCVGFAMASERSFFPRLSAIENLEFFAALDNVPRQVRRERIGMLIEATGLAHHADTLVMKFSSGMYQKLSIARALLKKPSVLLLDEPTRSLDPASAEEFHELMRGGLAHGATIVLATHSFEEAVALGDFVAVLRDGRLAAERNMDHIDARRLRSWYFNLTRERSALEEEFPVAAGGWR
jgi:ABC-2 type transport system ATP-binding protein